jgi:hypothetical protein
MHFVLSLQSPEEGDVYQVAETCLGHEPVVFSAPTLEACLSWLEAEGGRAWQSQKWNLLYLINSLGVLGVMDLQAALQQTGIKAYEELIAKGVSPESFDYTYRCLKGWTYTVLEWIQWEFEQELEQAHCLRQELSRGRGFLPRQNQKPRAQKKRRQTPQKRSKVKH